MSKRQLQSKAKSKARTCALCGRVVRNGTCPLCRVALCGWCINAVKREPYLRRVVTRRGR